MFQQCGIVLSVIVKIMYFVATFQNQEFVSDIVHVYLNIQNQYTDLPNLLDSGDITITYKVVLRWLSIRKW